MVASFGVPLRLTDDVVAADFREREFLLPSLQRLRGFEHVISFEEGGDIFGERHILDRARLGEALGRFKLGFGGIAGFVALLDFRSKSGGGRGRRNRRGWLGRVFDQNGIRGETSGGSGRGIRGISARLREGLGLGVKGRCSVEISFEKFDIAKADLGLAGERDLFCVQRIENRLGLLEIPGGINRDLGLAQFQPLGRLGRLEVDFEIIKPLRRSSGIVGFKLREEHVLEPEDLGGLKLRGESRAVFLEEHFEQFPAFAEFQSAKEIVPMPDRPLLEGGGLRRVAAEHLHERLAEEAIVGGQVEIGRREGIRKKWNLRSRHALSGFGD